MNSQIVPLGELPSARVPLLWEFGLEYRACRGDPRLPRPSSAFPMPDGRYMVADVELRCALLVDPRTGASTKFPSQNAVCWARPLEDGTVLLATDVGVEVHSPDGGVRQLTTVKNPNFVGQGREGRLLVVNCMDRKVVELDLNGNIVWTPPAKIRLKKPRSAFVDPGGSSC